MAHDQMQCTPKKHPPIVGDSEKKMDDTSHSGDDSIDSSNMVGKITINNSSDDSASESSTDNFSKLIFPKEDVYLLDLAIDPEINLLNVDQFQMECFFVRKLRTYLKCVELLNKS
jgi:hypothetical protein